MRRQPYELPWCLALLCICGWGATAAAKPPLSDSRVEPVAAATHCQITPLIDPWVSDSQPHCGGLITPEGWSMCLDARWRRNHESKTFWTFRLAAALELLIPAGWQRSEYDVEFGAPIESGTDLYTPSEWDEPQD